MGDNKNFVSLAKEVKSKELPYFISSSATGSVAGLQASELVPLPGYKPQNWKNASGTHSSDIIHTPSIDYGVKRNFRIEPKRVQPEPIKVWVMSRHIAYFDPKTSTYHIAMMKSMKKQRLTDLVFNIMSIFI